jgi:hypothetical protein
MVVAGTDSRVTTRVDWWTQGPRSGGREHPLPDRAWRAKTRDAARDWYASIAAAFTNGVPGL